MLRSFLTAPISQPFPPTPHHRENANRRLQKINTQPAFTRNCAFGG
ncbi:unnamed protein product, partial [Tenebrio molitor]